MKIKLLNFSRTEVNIVKVSLEPREIIQEANTTGQFLGKFASRGLGENNEMYASINEQFEVINITNLRVSMDIRPTTLKFSTDFGIYKSQI